LHREVVIMTNPSPIGAQIVAGIVQSLVYPHPDGFSLDECYPPDSGVVPIPDGKTVTVGMTWDGKVFGPPPPDPVMSAPPRTATVSALLDALSIPQRATITADHMSRLVARAATGPVVLGDPKVARAADDLSIAPDAWFTLAGA